jgi:hypothetical protein
MPRKPNSNSIDYTDEVKASIKEKIKDEVRIMMNENPDVQYWYTYGSPQAMKMMNDLIPQFQEGYGNNPDNGMPLQMLFWALISPLSGAQNPSQNTVLAFDVINHYVQEGKIPLTKNEAFETSNQGEMFSKDARERIAKGEDVQWTVRGKTTRNALQGIQKGIDKFGSLKTFMKWMVNKHPTQEVLDTYIELGFGQLATAKVLVRYADQDGLVYGSSLLGAKFSPFFQNNTGNEKVVTKDEWYTRAWNRIVGRLYAPNGKILSQPIGVPERIVQDEITTEIANDLNIEPAQAQALWWAYEQGLYSQLGVQSPTKDYIDGVTEVYKRKKGATEATNREREARARYTSNIAKSKGTETFDAREAILTQEQPKRTYPTQAIRLEALLKKPQEINKELINGVDIDGRNFLARVVVGLDKNLDDKPLSVEDATALLPYLGQTFKFMDQETQLKNNTRGRYNYEEQQIKIPPLKNVTNPDDYVFTFMHELGHSIERNSPLSPFINSMKEFQFDGKPFPNNKVKKVSSKVLKEAINASKEMRPERWSALQDYGNSIIAWGIDLRLRQRKLTDGKKRSTTILLAPTQEVRDEVLLDALDNKKYVNASGSNSEALKAINKFYDGLEYNYKGHEIQADGLAYYFLNPKTFKKKYPLWAEILRSAVAQSKFKDFLVLNSIIGMIGTAGLYALLSQYEDDEEGALNFGGGILAA